VHETIRTGRTGHHDAVRRDRRRAGRRCLKAAIAAPSRTPDNVKRDVYRHPYETLTFFGIKPNMTVVELAPGGGWYTEILAPYLRANGKLITGGNDLASPNENERKAAERWRV
jgi:predicted methyltransferase